MVGNCGYFDQKPFTYHVDNCRALGNTLNLTFGISDTVSLINSTLAGHGDCLIVGECDAGDCDGSEIIIIQNNIFRGYSEFGTGDLTCYIWLDQAGLYQTDIDYNIIYNTKISTIGYNNNDISEDPQVMNDVLDSFDGHLGSDSPAIDSGLAVGSLGGLIPDHDINGSARPIGSGVDRGAYEYNPQDVPTLNTWSFFIILFGFLLLYNGSRERKD